MGEEMLSINEMLDELCETMADTLFATGGDEYPVNWPFPIASVIEADAYIDAPFLKRFYDITKALEERGFADSEIAKSLKAPSRIAQYIWLLKGNKLIPLDKDQRVEVAEKIIRYMSYYKQDIFCKSEKNVLWSEEQIKNILNAGNIVDIGKTEEVEEFRRVIGKLNCVLWNLTEALYFACHAMGHEIHGPYELSKENEVLIVREYYDLRPVEIWAFMEGLSFNKVTTFEVYENIDIKFDMFNRMRSTDALPPHLIKFGLSVDERPLGISLDTLTKLFKEVENIMSNALEFGRGYFFSEDSFKNKKNVIIKDAEVYFYTLKPLAEALNEDWLPPQSLYESIDRQSMADSDFLRNIFGKLSMLPTLPMTEKREIIKKMYDPRID